MQHYFNSVINNVGVAIVGATVTIFNTGTQTKSTIYSDDGITAKTNPVITDSLGKFDFFIANGKYDIQVSGPGLATVTQNKVEINNITESATTDTPPVFNQVSFTGSVSGTTILAPAATASGTLTLPAATDTLVARSTTDTLVNKTLTTPNISTISNGGGTLTLPTSTDTLVGRATTDTLTNKTLDTAGTGNVFKINGTTIAATIGSGSVVLASFPVVTIPSNTSQKTESAADTNVFTLTPPTTAGSYRVRFVMSVSAANTATLGWTATWKDSNSNAQTPTNLALFQTGVAAPALTFTTSAAGNYHGFIDIDIDNSGTAIVVKLTFSGTSFAAKVTASIERLV